MEPTHETIDEKVENTIFRAAMLGITDDVISETQFVHGMVSAMDRVWGMKEAIRRTKGQDLFEVKDNFLEP